MKPKYEQRHEPAALLQYGSSSTPGLHSKDADFNKLYAREVQGKELFIQSEVNRIKQEKATLRTKKQEDEEALADLIKEVELRNERDLRARIEKDQIKKDLADLQKNKLTTLESNKKAQLENLALEREGLRLKEQQLIQDIAKLDTEVKVMDKIRADDINKKGNNVIDLMQRRGVNTSAQEVILKERSDKIAELKLRREYLEFERTRILEDKEKVKKGDLSSLKKPNYGLYSANQLLNNINGPTNYSSDNPLLRLKNADQQRLEQMKVVIQLIWF